MNATINEKTVVVEDSGLVRPPDRITLPHMPRKDSAEQVKPADTLRGLAASIAQLKPTVQPPPPPPPPPPPAPREPRVWSRPRESFD